MSWALYLTVLAYLQFQRQPKRFGSGPMKGALLAQEALQESKIKTRELQGGMKENTLMRGY